MDTPHDMSPQADTLTTATTPTTLTLDGPVSVIEDCGLERGWMMGHARERQIVHILAQYRPNDEAVR